MTNKQIELRTLRYLVENGGSLTKSDLCRAFRNRVPLLQRRDAVRTLLADRAISEGRGEVERGFPPIIYSVTRHGKAVLRAAGGRE